MARGVPGPGPMGVVLAGGGSSRFGSPKGLAPVAGVPIVERVVAALQAVAAEILISANEATQFRSLGLSVVPDEHPGLGPLGGLHAALAAAHRAGHPGVLTLPWDLPFPSIPLMEELAARAFGGGTAGPGAGDGGDPLPEPPDVVLPASRGPRGLEPLVGAYRISCLPAVEGAIREGDRRMIGFHPRVVVHTIPLEVVETLCDPQRAFMNVNTPEDRKRAEELAAGTAAEDS